MVVSGRDGLPRRLVGILVSPRETLHRVMARPRSAGVLAAVTLAATLSGAAFLLTDTGHVALLDRQVARLEWFGADVSDEQYEALERGVPAAVWRRLAGIAFGYPAAVYGLAGVLFLGGRRLGAGGPSFPQTVAIVAHAGVLFGVQQVVAHAAAFRREALGSPLTLGTFMPGLDDSSFLGGLMFGIDLFHVWGTVVLAIGLSVLFGRPARRFIGPLVGGYAAVAAIFALIGVLLGGA